LSEWETASTARVTPPARPRKLAKVPFVELADGRLQGVVSSGSDIERVYVSSVATGTFAYACSTNNNRPCGGARGGYCNHIRALITEAVLQYGPDRVARYLRLDPADDGAEPTAQSITAAMSATHPQPDPGKAAASVFSRFLRHLAYLEPAPTTVPSPEMHWFPPTRATTPTPPAGAGPDDPDAALLGSPVPGLDDALDAVGALDRALVGGLLRPAPAQAADLQVFAAALAASPLAARTAEAAEKAAAGAAGEDHFTALAAARTALLGSVHDALTARGEELTGRAHGADPEPTPAAPQPANLLAAARSWLCDLARTGWRNLDHEVVAGAAPVVSAMLQEPSLRRLAMLLDGLATELAASCPGSALERVPERRWGDLWSRAMLLTVPGAAGAAPAGTDTGRLLPLGIDLHEHATAVQAQVHAVLEAADGSAPRLVRAAVSVPKPDTVVGAGVWQLLRPHLSLLGAVGEGRATDVTDMPVTAEGDLLWDEEHARTGEPADAFATARVALPTATAAATAPLDRHPARIAEPVFLEGYGSETDEDTGTLTFTVAGHRLVVDTDRVPAAGPLTPEAVAASHACIGLLRWDAGRFRLQPLAVETTVRKKPVAVHAGAWAGGTTDKAGLKAEKAATDAVTVLRERAGRLLRK
jgi:hypothetical protein